MTDYTLIVALTTLVATCLTAIGLVLKLNKHIRDDYTQRITESEYNTDNKINSIVDKMSYIIDKLEDYEKEVERVYLRKETFFEIEKRWSASFSTIMDKQNAIEKKLDETISVIHAYIIKNKENI